jgi:hypothetical protein
LKRKHQTHSHLVPLDGLFLAQNHVKGSYVVCERLCLGLYSVRRRQEVRRMVAFIVQRLFVEKVT